VIAEPARITRAVPGVTGDVAALDLRAPIVAGF
jgi:hypothetical protein